MNMRWKRTFSLFAENSDDKWEDYKIVQDNDAHGQQESPMHGQFWQGAPTT